MGKEKGSGVFCTAGFIILCTLLFNPSQVIFAQSTIPPPASTHLASWPVAISPNDIATNPEDGTIAVIDAGNGSVEILRPGGTHKTVLMGFEDPRSAAFLPGGILLVGETGKGSVNGYNEQGFPVFSLGNGEGEFVTPNDIAVHTVTGRIYVVDSSAHLVKVYRQSDGVLEFQFGAPGSGPGEFNFPVSIAINPALGEVYIGDSRNRRIAVFNSETGDFLRNISQAGDDPDDISFMGGLHVDSDHRLYVVESLGGYILMLDPDGELVGHIGLHGSGPGQLRNPKAVSIDRYNRLLVTSLVDRKIEVWGLDEFENPADPDLIVHARAIPDYLDNLEPNFKVVLEVYNENAAELDPLSLQINRSVRPVPLSWRLGYFLTAMFSTAEVVDTLPTTIPEVVVLELTGATYTGLKFSTELLVSIDPDGYQGGLSHQTPPFTAISRPNSAPEGGTQE